MVLRRWQLSDKSQLIPLIVAYMVETPEYGYAPTARNAETLFNMGVSGMGVLAETAENGIVGFYNLIHDALDHRPSTCYGMGTYVVPEYRRRGVAKALHDSGAKLAVDYGYKVCERVAHGGMGEPMLNRDGWEPAGTVYRRAL